jgi:hypothetical protein
VPGHSFSMREHRFEESELCRNCQKDGIDLCDLLATAIVRRCSISHGDDHRIGVRAARGILLRLAA